MAKKNRGKRATARGRNNVSKFTGGVGGSPLRSLMYNPTNPGRAVMRGAIEVFNGNNNYQFSYRSFNNWCGPARNLLVPFQYFRVTDVIIKPVIAGGTATAHSLVFNVSNANVHDVGAVSILDDDYAGVCNATNSIVLRPPQVYWAGGSRTWYAALDPVIGTPPVPDAPLPQELVAGVVSTYASGGATGTTVVAWMVIEFVLEFHTLV